MPEVYVAVGSNIEPEKHLRAAVTSLAKRFGLLRLSPVYRNRAVGFEGDDFLNMVIAFETDTEMAAVVGAMEQIEAENGRSRGDAKFAPRTLDLDLLLFGDHEERCGTIEVPRKEIVRYAFILKPLADLAGAMRHPVDGRSFDEIWAAFDKDSHPLDMVGLQWAQASSG